MCPSLLFEIWYVMSDAMGHEFGKYNKRERIEVYGAPGEIPELVWRTFAHICKLEDDEFDPSKCEVWNDDTTGPLLFTVKLIDLPMLAKGETIEFRRVD